ncbi:HSP20 domain-containing protein [Cephalotus follicularis]|uniref:HSP20 domain-containing protein n=1 Tax=Cephalotus follicularis TaxID=3775 RepID=A0A1Q3CAQ6_CEPFO|nr:HSP20 domain-containing protein [Cephalotus follicularis]
MSLILSLFSNRRGDFFYPFTWDPFSDTPFSSPSSLSSLFPQETSSFINIRVDWKEIPEAHVFKADLPGLKKEEGKIEVEDDRVLQINEERKVEEEKSDTWHKLPENVKLDEIKASIPKVEVKKPDVKSIQIFD